MNDFKVPEKMSLDGNPAENWKRWKQRFELFLTAKEFNGKDDGIKIAMLLSAIGPECLERYNNLTWAAGEDKTDFATVMTKLETEFTGLKRGMFSRFQFYTYERPEGQCFDDHLNKLRTLATACEFAEKDNMIRDRIVCSMKAKPVLQRLLRQPDPLTLQQTIDIVRSAEVTQKEAKKMNCDDNSSKSVDSVSGATGRRKKGAGRPNQRHKESNRTEAQKKCSKCGLSHEAGKCPAYGKQCHKCKGKNHFQRFCRASRARVHEVTHDDYEDSEYSEDEFFIDVIDYVIGDIDSNEETDEVWFQVVKVADSKVNFKLDSGANANVIPEKTFVKLKDAHKLPKSALNARLRSYGGALIPHQGRVFLSCRINGKVQTHGFFVTNREVKSPPILGLKSSVTLGLIQKVDVNVDAVIANVSSIDSKEKINKEYGDLFHGLGCFQDPYDITIDDSVSPVIHAQRKVPLALHDRLKNKLDQMEKDGIITSVTEPTDWVSSLVIVEKKNGDLRICLDPKDLNRAIKREHFKIPTYDDVIGKLGGKKVFTVLDLKDAYWQVPLTEKSSLLTTFNTPFGRKRFLRMPFGVCSASEVMQHRAYKTFGDIDGVDVISDDMIIAGNDDHDHDEILLKVFERARERNVKFNWPKLQYKLPEVSYMGNIVGAEGVRPDPKKVAAIVDMPSPTCKPDVKRLIGMLNYLSQYIPNMPAITTPLRKLLKNDVVFEWNHEQQESFDKIKDILSSSPCLRVYDAKKDITIQTDSSLDGIGCCLLQENQPVAYASRPLEDRETRWAPIEREMMAIVFAAEKFHTYIYGNDVLVHSDHKPIPMIMKKPISKASPRIQYMMLRLLRYNLEVVYKQGCKMYISDTISRAINQNPANREKDSATSMYSEMDIRIHSLIDYLPVGEQRLQQIMEATKDDLVLQRVISYASKGWPDYKSDCHLSVRYYWNIRDELHVVNDVLFLGDRIVVPEVMRQEIIENSMKVILVLRSTNHVPE